MGILVTEVSRIKQDDKEPKRYILSDNSLYWDDDGSLYILPRLYKSDGYTIPNWIAWLAGGKMEYDLRPAHFHDFMCQWHAVVKVVGLDVADLKAQGLLHLHYSVENQKLIYVLEDIPISKLELVPMTKWDVDCMFKRIMLATGNIPKWRVNLMRAGVVFNFGWITSRKNKFDMSKCYKLQDDDKTSIPNT